MNKEKQLQQLAEKRKLYPLPDGYRRISDYYGGSYECNHVSPYTKSAKRLDADIFVLLQDWSSDKALSKKFCQDSETFGHTRTIQTNIMLKQLLKEHFKCELEDTYATNLFPFVKPGKMSAKIQSKIYLDSALNFALPQIQIIQPKLVICLGMDTFNAVRVALGEQAVSNFEEGINSSFSYSNPPVKIWLQAHTGYWGQWHRKGKVAEDWEKMAAEFRTL